MAARQKDTKLQRNVTELNQRLSIDLSSFYLCDAMMEIHPTILQDAMKRFAQVMMLREGEDHINVERILEILKS